MKTVGIGMKNKEKIQNDEEPDNQKLHNEAQVIDNEDKKKLSYMEKRELDQLTKEILILEKERDEISRIFDQKDVAYDDIKTLSDALGVILRQLEQKEYRWFELSSRE